MWLGLLVVGVVCLVCCFCGVGFVWILDLVDWISLRGFWFWLVCCLFAGGFGCRLFGFGWVGF